MHDDPRWQAVFRAKKIDGPYEGYTTMEQGDTLVNGPHQGAWVQTRTGEDWFTHFQSRLAYGRIVHLQPLQWVNDWPVIGSDDDGHGVGNPVSVYRKPDVGNIDGLVLPTATAPPSSDEFDQPDLGVQWQWNANSRSDWYSLAARDGYLRLFARQPPLYDGENLWMMPSLLLQKIPAPAFIAEVELDIPENAPDMSTGLVMFGEDYAWIGLRHDAGSGETLLGYASCRDARSACDENFKTEKVFNANTLTLRMTMAEGGSTVFGYLSCIVL